MPLIIFSFFILVIHRIYLSGWQSGIGRARQLLLARYVGHTKQPCENQEAGASDVFSMPFFLFGFTLGQVISAAKEDIIKAYYPGYFVQSVEGQIQTKQVQAKHDDSYQGKRDWLKLSPFMINAH